MMKRSVIAMLVVCATVVGNAADFSEGKFAQGQYNDPSDGSMWFRELGDSEWDGTRLYDEYMDVGGVKYPVVNESQVLLLPISVTPGEKVTPVIASGTAPASAVTLKCLSDAEVLAKFRKFKDGDVQNYWIQDQWPRNAARSYRAWIYVGLKNGQSKLRATCDVSSRLAPQMAPGVQSGDTLTQYAARFGINFCGALMSSPSLWIEVGLRESGKVWPSRIYCDCRGSCMSPRELARWLSLEEAVADAASEMFSDEDRGESAGEALVCAAAWYIAPLDAGAYEVVLRSSDLMKGQVTGGGLV